jgi:uncharacterized membrane protein
MRHIRQLILLVAILINSLSITFLSAQESVERPPWDKSIESQFNFIIDKSSKYEEFRVVKSTWFFTLRSHVLDSLKSARKKLTETQLLVLTKDHKIDTLKSNLLNINEKLTSVNKEKNSIRFLGIQMAKYYYNSLLWSIIIGLFSLLLFFIMLFRRSNVVTVQTKASLTETKEEFEEHRKRAREREEKLARQYLDELNKYKGKDKK